MRALLLASLCASAACLRTVTLPAGLRRAGLSTRTGVRLCEADDDAARPSAAKSAQEIRLQAERLALQAEKAALEAEQLTLQAEQLKLATAQRRRETDASGATTPEPAPATESSAKPLDRDPWTADAAQRTDSAPESVSPAPIEASVGGVFNLSLAGPNGSAPLKGQLQQALEIRGLREPSELQLTATQTALIKSEVFDMETFYTMKAPTSTRIRLFLARGPPGSAHPRGPSPTLPHHTCSHIQVEDSPVGTIFRGNLRADAGAPSHRTAKRSPLPSRHTSAETAIGPPAFFPMHLPAIARSPRSSIGCPLPSPTDVVFSRVQEKLANASRSPQAEGLAGVQLLLIEDPLPLTLAQLEGTLHDSNRACSCQPCLVPGFPPRARWPWASVQGCVPA